jgi:hypothetical protein
VLLIISADAEPGDGSAGPDDRAWYNIELAPLPLVALQKHLEPTQGSSLIKVPLLTSVMDERWRVREINDLRIIMLRLQLWRYAFRKETITLKEFSELFDKTPLADMSIMVPAAGYAPKSVGGQFPQNKQIRPLCQSVPAIAAYCRQNVSAAVGDDRQGSKSRR